MKGNKGFSLLEMAIVLSIIAILAAILTPIVTSYVDQARVTRAHADVTAIRDAILLYKRDTSYWPSFDTLATAKTGTTPGRDCLLSGTDTAATTPSGWTCNAKGLLSSYLNLNSLGITSSGNLTGGTIAYRGPYLDGVTGNDPWSNPYWVNSTYLASTGANTANWAVVFSLGPDGTMNTSQTQAHTGNFAASGDDITAVIK